MHCLSWLATNGTAAIVCFPDIMYRGGAEQKIRKYLIDNNYIECIIQLPDNLFYGTRIATCIMVLKKSKVDNQTLFIDASKEFVKSTNSNKLGDGSVSNEHDNIQNILNAISTERLKSILLLLLNRKILKITITIFLHQLMWKARIQEKLLISPSLTSKYLKLFSVKIHCVPKLMRL